MENINQKLQLRSRKRIFQKITLMGCLVDALLGIGKIIIGLRFFSYSLVIDAIHSFSDCITDIFVLFISHIGHLDPDEKHPYGYGKYETLGTTALGSILITTAVILIYESATNFFDTSSHIQKSSIWQVIATALISALVKETLYRVTMKVGQNIDSSLLRANAWHSRSDALSSLLVIIGSVFASYGIFWADQVMGILIACIIGHVGWKFIRESIPKLAEQNLNSKIRNQILEIILSQEGIESAHNLRVRKMGHQMVLDVNVEVNERITVSEGHEISTWVTKVLKEKFTDLSDVIVHTDIENDMIDDINHNNSNLLPLRSEILSSLHSIWKDYDPYKQVQHINIHYINRKIDIELQINPEIKENISIQDYKKLIQLEVKQMKQNAAKTFSWFHNVFILIIV